LYLKYVIKRKKYITLSEQYQNTTEKTFAIGAYHH